MNVWVYNIYLNENSNRRNRGVLEVGGIVFYDEKRRKLFW